MVKAFSRFRDPAADRARVAYVDALLRELDRERSIRIVARIRRPRDPRSRWEVPPSRLFLAVGIDLTAAGLLATLVVPTAELFLSVVLVLDFLAVVAVAAAILLLPAKADFVGRPSRSARALARTWAARVARMGLQRGAR